MVWPIMGGAGSWIAMLGVLRWEVNEGHTEWMQKRTNPAISGFPKPLPTRWFKRLRAATSICATFRPLFRLGGRWSASIGSETHSCEAIRSSASSLWTAGFCRIATIFTADIDYLGEKALVLVAKYI